MEKLTLEHASAYLSYDLKVLHTDTDSEGSFTQIVSLSTAGSECLTFKNDFHGASDYHFDSDENPEIKLLMYPISYLRTDEGFDKYIELCEKLDMVSCEHLIKAIENGKYYAISLNMYYVLEKWMYSNHFDWKYNLIEKGLAIDVNTLETNPYE